MFAVYVHDLNPVIFHVTDSFSPRWYGFAYVLGFFFGYLLLKKLVDKGCCELRREQVGDFITFSALFGVMLGGRLGHMLLYDLDGFIENPLSFFYLSEGGMASHGGIFGLVLFTLWYSRRHKISWTGLGDNLVVVAPIGLFFGRLANFINGELYGTPGNPPWAVKFPLAVNEDLATPGSNGSFSVGEGLARFNSAEPTTHFQSPRELAEAVRDNPDIKAKAGELLVPRHPSQIYEALLEGLFLFVVLLVVRLRFKKIPHGTLTGLFFLIYAIVRIIGEEFRQPDSERILGMTAGQFYSLFMVVAGFLFLGYAILRRRRESGSKDDDNGRKPRTQKRKNQAG